MPNVYLDHAAAAPLDSRVLAAMRPWLTKNFANPSALYAAAVAAREAIEQARKKVADILFTQPDTIIFTSGGTESINLALQGVARKHENTKTRKHIVSTLVEHHAVQHTLKEFEKQGWRVTYLPVDRAGKIDLDDFKKALRQDTILVSIQYANNEVGTIQPIAEIGREILKWRKAHRTAYNLDNSTTLQPPFFHTDACQAAAYLDLNVEKLHVDLMSLNGSKIYGPKGVGVLYKRRGVDIQPLMYGGGQEFGLRPGTENVAGIVGLATAIAECRMQNAELKRISKLRDYFWSGLQERIDDVKLNGSVLDSKIKNTKPKIQKYKSPNAERRTLNAELVRLPNNLNLTFPGTDTEALIIYLDAAGIQCSSQSACSTDADEVSHVLLACGVSAQAAKESVRFTLGKETTKKDINYVLKCLPKVVEELRRALIP